MKHTAVIITVAACLAGGFTINAVAEGGKKQEMTVKQVMKDKMKGDTSAIKKAIKGELSKEEVSSLLAAVKTMIDNKPPKGDEASWKEKCDALVSACEKLEKGEAGAGDAVKAAANCKACHDVHKGK